MVGMRLEDQVRLVQDYDIILEHCFAQPMGGGKYKSNLPLNLEAIQACGYKNVMVSTDGGQVENPFWEAALEHIPSSRKDIHQKIYPQSTYCP